MRRALLTGATTSCLVLAALTPPALATEEVEGCSPVRGDVPVCPEDAPVGTATFLDPTAVVSGGRHISLAEQVYVGPFARLLANEAAPISIGAESNAQDNVLIAGSRDCDGYRGDEDAGPPRASRPSPAWRSASG